jgi:hypothetical protein
VRVHIHWRDGRYTWQPEPNPNAVGAIEIPDEVYALWVQARTLDELVQRQMWRLEEDADIRQKATEAFESRAECVLDPEWEVEQGEIAATQGILPGT